MSNDLVITKDLLPEGIKFTINGRIYSNNADKLQQYLDETLGNFQDKKHINIVFNMTQVDYISSTGIRVILKTYMDAKKAGGKLEIEAPSPSVMSILKITALDEMLVLPPNPETTDTNSESDARGNS